AIRVDGNRAERRAALLVLLAAEVVVVLDHPAAGDRSPRQLHALAGGKAAGAHLHRGADDGGLVVGEIERGDRRGSRGRAGRRCLRDRRTRAGGGESGGKAERRLSKKCSPPPKFEVRSQKERPATGRS